MKVHTRRLCTQEWRCTSVDCACATHTHTHTHTCQEVYPVDIGKEPGDALSASGMGYYQDMTGLREDQPPLTSLYQYLVTITYPSPKLENPSAGLGAAARDGVGRRELVQRLPFREASFASSRLPIAPRRPHGLPWLPRMACYYPSLALCCHHATLDPS